MAYTPQQKDAIRTVDGHLQIIACAGSGKTEVMCARIIEILRVKRSAGIAPGNIVAFTFTEKAAGELKDRLTKMHYEAFNTLTGLSDMYVGTIHGYCLRLLQSEPVYRYLKYGIVERCAAAPLHRWL